MARGAAGNTIMMKPFANLPLTENRFELLLIITTVKKGGLPFLLFLSSIYLLYLFPIIRKPTLILNLKK